MMLKGVQTAAAGTASARGASSRTAPFRRHAAFTGVRPSVRVFAAEGEEPKAEKAPRAKREPKVYTVQVEDLQEGAELEGTVVSVEDYGAFVDFGAKVQGMIHVSKLASGFVKNAKDVVKVGESVTVKVIGVDAAKGRVSLALKGYDEAAEEPAPSYTPRDDAESDAEEEDDSHLWGVDLEDGQVAVQADVRGFDDLAFVLEESNSDEITEAGIAQLEADLDAVELKYEVDAPPYLEEVSGSITRMEDYGVFVEFAWGGQTLTGLLAREELKVPFAALPEARKAEVEAEWARSGLAPPTFVDLGEDQFDIKAYYKPGDIVTAYVLDSDTEGRGIALTQFSDDEVIGEAIEVYEGLEDDDDELLDALVESGLADEVLPANLEDLLEENGAAAEADTAAEEDVDSSVAAEYAAKGGMLRSKDGTLVSPMGLPSRPLNVLDRSALAPLSNSIVDFEGDTVELNDYWAIDYVVPKHPMAKVGLKMGFDEAGNAVFTEREDFTGPLPAFSLNGDVSSRAAAFVEDLLTADDEEVELPARAGRRPIVLAAAVSSISAATVKQLREKTGAGMMDCKKALAECNGDMDAASEVL